MSGFNNNQVYQVSNFLQEYMLQNNIAFLTADKCADLLAEKNILANNVGPKPGFNFRQMLRDGRDGYIDLVVGAYQKKTNTKWTIYRNRNYKNRTSKSKNSFNAKNTNASTKTYKVEPINDKNAGCGLILIIFIIIFVIYSIISAIMETPEEAEREFIEQQKRIYKYEKKQKETEEYYNLLKAKAKNEADNE